MMQMTTTHVSAEAQWERLVRVWDDDAHIHNSVQDKVSACRARIKASTPKELALLRTPYTIRSSAERNRFNSSIDYSYILSRYESEVLAPILNARVIKQPIHYYYVQEWDWWYRLDELVYDHSRGTYYYTSTNAFTDKAYRVYVTGERHTYMKPVLITGSTDIVYHRDDSEDAYTILIEHMTAALVQLRVDYSKRLQPDVSKQAGDTAYMHGLIHDSRELHYGRRATKQQFHEWIRQYYLQRPYVVTISELFDHYISSRDTTRHVAAAAEGVGSRIPWKTKGKVLAVAKHLGVDHDAALAHYRQLDKDNFSIKRQRQYYMKTCAPSGTYLIDFMFAGRFTYMVAINVNTRVAHAYLPGIIKQTPSGGYSVPATDIKTVRSISGMLTQLLQEATVKHIICDQESGFMSASIRQLLQSHGITLRAYVKNTLPKEMGAGTTKSRGNHTTLAVIDRFIRTVRDMAHTLKPYEADIRPDLMRYIIDCYNNTPHSSFRQVLHEDITPAQMGSDRVLETRYVREVLRHNLLVVHADGYELDTTAVYRIHNEHSTLVKRRAQFLPGRYRYAGVREDGLYVMQRVDGPEVLKVPRWAVCPLKRSVVP